MDELFKEMAQNIRIYLGKEQSQDPYEKNVEVLSLYSLPIKAIVTDLSPTSAEWKMPGITTSQVKEIIIKKKYESLLLKSQKIKIQGEYYQGWRINGKLSYRIEGKYLRAYIYIKKV